MNTRVTKVNELRIIIPDIIYNIKMSKNIRKLNAEIEKNMKAIDDVPTTIHLIYDIVMGNRDIRYSRIETTKCSNTISKRKVRDRNEKRDKKVTEGA